MRGRTVNWLGLLLGFLGLALEILNFVLVKISLSALWGNLNIFDLSLATILALVICLLGLWGFVKITSSKTYSVGQWFAFWLGISMVSNSIIYYGLIALKILPMLVVPWLLPCLCASVIFVVITCLRFYFTTKYQSYLVDFKFG